ncbi:MAG: phage baseplate assembly protein [Oscillospiraceae bacterium]
MLYTLNKANYRDFDTYEIGKLSGRAYFIPYSDKKALKKTTCLTERYESDKVRVLSGEWDFKYYDKLSVMPTDFDSERTSFDKVTVPSTWQRTGYDAPAYINQSYAFKLVPPELPQDFPVSIYRKKIDIQNLDKTYIITFLGVVARGGSKLLQLTGLTDEVLDETELVQQVGFSSYIPEGCRVVF